MRHIKIQFNAVVEVLIQEDGQKFMTIKPFKHKAIKQMELTAQELLEELE